MFPVYAFPPALACAVIVALAVMSLTYARRDRVSVSFATFCFAWALVAALSLVLQLTGYLWAARLAPGAVWLTYVFLAVYIVTLTGDDRDLKRAFFGIPLTVWLTSLVALAIVGGILSATTNLVVMGLERDPTWGYNLIFNPWAIAIHFPFVLLGLFGLGVLHSAWSQEASPARRVFLRNNLIAVGAIFAGVAVFAAILPRFGLPTFAAVFDVFGLTAFFFFGAIANYQFRRVEELNAGLEQRVRERTQALRQAQAQLVQAEKMMALSRLVAGVAHEINSPLGAVRSAQDTLVRATASVIETAREGRDPPQLARLDRLEQALRDGDRVVTDGIERIDGIVKRLKSFARLDESEVQTVDLNQSLNEVLALLRHELDGTTIDREFAATRKVTCMSRQLNQVFLNLLTNAAQAVDHRGRICVHTADAPNGIEIKIVDDGPGIAPEHRPHIFDPGFTTRGVGVGTGMGLAIAYRVVDDHGGRIAVDSEVGHGTAVTVHLPERRPS